MLWSLPPSAVQMFLDEAHAAAAAMAARPMASGWRRLDELIRDADWRPAWQIAGEAARRCRAYEKIDGAYGRALAAWYRALALVLLAGVRDTHRRAWRDSGDGAEDEPGADDGPEPPDGPVDTDASFAAAMARYPSLVTW